MVFSKDNLSVIKILRQDKHYGAKRFWKEFPNRNWSIAALNRLIAKIDATGSVEKRCGGRLRTAGTMENVDSVEILVSSQEYRPGSYRTIRQESRKTGISRTSVYRII